jgi:2-hydroxychromene-2-carboxylate isomerase
MKQIGFWFDPISPFAYLAFERLPEVLAGCSYAVEYRPLLFAGLLAQWGQKGPAEIEPKRQWTFRHLAWLAQHHVVPMQTPATHPFNPLPVLRLLVAAGANRRTVELAMRHVWRGDGAEATDAARLQTLAAAMNPARDPASPEVKAELRAATDAAIARGIFGVPTFELDGRLFWGLDALPMLRAALLGDAWFDGAAWDEAARPRPGVVRGG